MSPPNHGETSSSVADSIFQIEGGYVKVKGVRARAGEPQADTGAG